MGTELVSPVTGALVEPAEAGAEGGASTAADFEIDLTGREPAACLVDHASSAATEGAGSPDRIALAFPSETCEACQLIDRLKRHDRTQAPRRLRQLYRIYLDYPLDTIRPAVATALEYGLLDLVRIEQMILRRDAGAYFRLPTNTENSHER